MKKTALLTLTRLCLAALAVGVVMPAVPAGAAQLLPGRQQPAPAPAGNNESGQALEIGPPVINLKGDPGQTLKTEIMVRSVSNGKLTVKGQVNDFTAGGDDGTPNLLLEEGEVSPFSMKSWVTPLPQMTLESKQLKQLPVTITIPKDAAPGGYYSVIRFTGTPPELEGTGVSLSASLGSLIFLKVNGDAKEGLEIAEFSTNTYRKATRPGDPDKYTPTGLFESAPVHFVQQLKNTGNIHEQPGGQIIIKDMFDKKIAAVNVNLPPRNVLPQSTRKFTQVLDGGQLGSRQLFGKYTATMKLSYGTNNQSVEKTITFWVLPYKLIAIVIAVLIGGFFLFRFLLRRHNERIIRQATQQRSSRSRRPRR
ncbi:hypothetical protein JNJ66_06465 [Candidatus Saccharibacteria bacterium]|nr:hypothetical protein [Candidatus Saccharibacteria bacterium]